MKSNPNSHGLEFLLAFDGHIHHLEAGHWLKFEIRRTRASKERPHGLTYSFTLHAPDGTRLVGFDNAHGVPGGAKPGHAPATDHRHGGPKDQVRPYAFRDAETLVDDFFREVERVLKSRGVGMAVVRMERKERTK